MQGNALKRYFLSQFNFLPLENRKSRLKGAILKKTLRTKEEQQ